MKNITLDTLCIDNFKGCAHMRLDFGGRSGAIYGTNGAGKTTVYDAFTWLLFGKDSQGNTDSNFDIKPHDKAGEILDHAAVTSVEAVLNVDGLPLTLKRTYFERWSVKRGSSEASYDGNTSDFFVDGVPSRKNEYERCVHELVDEDLFRTLTNVFWFSEGMDWKSRRSLLFSVCGVPDDFTIMASNPAKFSDLQCAAGTLTVDSFKKKLLARRKNLNGARDTVPARIDEQQKTITALAGIDFDALGTQRDALAAQQEKLQTELMQLGQGTLLQSKRNELADAQNELTRLDLENREFRQTQAVPVEDRRPALQAEYSAARRKQEQLQSSVAYAEGEITRLNEEIQRQRSAWLAADGEVFAGAGVCPTCGQKLPEAAQETARMKFEADKDRRKANALAAANTAKERLKAVEESLAENMVQLDKANEEAKALESGLAAYIPPEKPVIRDLPDYAARRQAANGRVQQANTEVQSLLMKDAALRNELNEKIKNVRLSIAETDRSLARKEMLSLARTRLEELRQEAQKTAQKLEELDRQLDLCEEFTRYKVRYIENSINDHFTVVRFKLFAEQVNGGMSDCCEVLVNGSRVGRGANTGAVYNAGLDIIRTLSLHYGVSVPIFIDGAESVVSLLDTGAQVIRLEVSKEDKELRCTYEYEN